MSRGPEGSVRARLEESEGEVSEEISEDVARQKLEQLSGRLRIGTIMLSYFTGVTEVLARYAPHMPTSPTMLPAARLPRKLQEAFPTFPMVEFRAGTSSFGHPTIEVSNGNHRVGYEVRNGLVKRFDQNLNSTRVNEQARYNEPDASDSVELLFDLALSDLLRPPGPDSRLLGRLENAIAAWKKPKGEVTKADVQRALTFITEVFHVGSALTKNFEWTSYEVLSEPEGEDGQRRDSLSFYASSSKLVVWHIKGEGPAAETQMATINVAEERDGIEDTDVRLTQGGTKKHYSFSAAHEPQSVVEITEHVLTTAEAMQRLLKERVKPQPEVVQAAEGREKQVEAPTAPSANAVERNELPTIQERLREALTTWTVPEGEITVSAAEYALRFMGKVNEAGRDMTRAGIQLETVTVEPKTEGEPAIEHSVSIITVGNLTIFRHFKVSAGETAPVISRREIRLSSVGITPSVVDGVLDIEENDGHTVVPFYGSDEPHFTVAAAAGLREIAEVMSIAQAKEHMKATDLSDPN